MSHRGRCVDKQRGAERTSVEVSRCRVRNSDGVCVAPFLGLCHRYGGRKIIGYERCMRHGRKFACLGRPGNGTGLPGACLRPQSRLASRIGWAQVSGPCAARFTAVSKAGVAGKRELEKCGLECASTSDGRAQGRQASGEVSRPARKSRWGRTGVRI